jgi:hypothetical protein
LSAFFLFLTQTQKNKMIVIKKLRRRRYTNVAALLLRMDDAVKSENNYAEFEECVRALVIERLQYPVDRAYDVLEHAPISAKKLTVLENILGWEVRDFADVNIEMKPADVRRWLSDPALEPSTVARLLCTAIDPYRANLDLEVLLLLVRDGRAYLTAETCADIDEHGERAHLIWAIMNANRVRVV